ncbi:hypothetical protein HZC21_03920 [Candidatus Peregrinibacteria bacterium]|nr:hypothetical protein [Candidatus Peregrinibacteria bacterium]
MERRGIYRKGSAGHARSVNLYRLFRQRSQHSKKWRWPITAVLALMLVFGIAPSVGDDFQFQTSVLTADEKQVLLNAEPEVFKKSLLNVLKTFVDDCGRFRLADCVSAGQVLMNDVVNARGDLAKYLDKAEDFFSRFETDVALNACKFDLGKIVAEGAQTKNNLNDFLGKYGDVLENVELQDFSAAISSSLNKIKSFVDSCGAKL